MPDPIRKPGGAGLDGLDGLDRLLEHRSRLGASALMAREGAVSFTTLKAALGESDGNLGAHLRKLEEAGYIRVRKSFRLRKPLSEYSLSPLGRRRLEAHVAALGRLIGGIQDTSGTA